MSCIHNNAGKCELYNNSRCNIPPSQCRYFKDPSGLHCLTDWSQIGPNNDHTHSDPNKIYGITTKPSYCKFCFNARVYKPTDEELMDPFATELTDENDSSSCSVGHCFSRNRRFMINSGHGHPVNIEFEEWTEKMQEWHRVGIYYPKYCPECGRKLDEYEERALNNE